MPVRPTYPGVYIEEIPSGVRPIVGVSTSVGAFVDFFARGPMNLARQIFNMGDFERELGGLHLQSESSYAIQQFFLNGGTEAWVVRVGAGTLARATVDIGDGTGSSIVLTAKNEGQWGNNLQARVEPPADPSATASEFDLVVTEYATAGGRLVAARQERFGRLSITATDPRYVARVINDATMGSKLVDVTVAGARPSFNGTVSVAHTAVPGLAGAQSVSVTIGAVTATVNFTLGPIGTATLDQRLAHIAQAFQDGLRSARRDVVEFANASVDVIGRRLRVFSGGTNPSQLVTIAAGTAANGMQFTGPGTLAPNVQEYRFGIPAVPATSHRGGVTGLDGTPPGAGELIGSYGGKTGIYALRDVDMFNLVCLPRAVALGQTDMQAVIAVALAFCEERRAFLLVDIPTGTDDIDEIRAWMQANDGLRSRNAAVYYPRVRIPDPLDSFRLRDVAASGTIAGLYARTDSTRGVWKAPAGTEAGLRNVPELTDVLTDPENGALNPLAINCLRTFPIYGTVCWGARTLEGADARGSEWKYIPVRRIALFIEESLYRGTKWAVFEPNDEPLWAQLRLNVGAFMHNLFRQGAFAGRAPSEAYLVRCDAETTTQNDVDLGIVNIIVGFRPLKPAEFVIIKIQQLAGQVQA